MQLRKTGSSHKRKSCAFHDVTLAKEGSMIQTMTQVRLKCDPEVQILQLQCLNFRKQCRMFGRARQFCKTRWDLSQPASSPTSCKTISTILEGKRYSFVIDKKSAWSLSDYELIRGGVIINIQKIWGKFPNRWGGGGLKKNPKFKLRILNPRRVLSSQKCLNYSLLSDPILRKKNKWLHLPIFNVNMPR